MSLARRAFDSSRFDECLSFLSRLPPDSERNRLESQAAYALGKYLLAQGRISESREQFRTAATRREIPVVMSLSQERNRLLEVLLRDRSQSVLAILGSASQARIKEVLELYEDEFAPEIDYVGCVAAYRSGYDPEKGDALSRLIRRLKRGGEQSTIVELGNLLADFVFSETDLIETVDFILPVPQEPERAQLRNYSIPDLLAKVVSDRCAIPICDKVIATTGTLPELRKIPRRHRMSALEGMFESQATEWIEERQILIVDDVITTGATIKSMAKELKQAGAATVSAVALAHTESSFW